VRADAWNVRTWLLAVVAGWAVLVALLALFGLGSRITPLPDDPALVQKLPRLPAAPPERLGPLEQYADVGGRPLFSEDRRPKPFFLSGEEAAAPAFDLVLTSVLITPSLQLAIVQPAQGGEGLRVKVGESPAGFPGWQLAELGPRRAVFDGPEGRRELELRIFDGASGQPPTQVAGAMPGTPPLTAVPPAGAVAPPAAPGGRTTGGNSPPAVMPTPPGAAASMPAAPVTPSASADAAAPAATTEEQMEAIRQRIEQRRAQLRQQQAQPTTPPATPGKTQ
jgi:general secretion pathway protein N